MRSVPSTGLLNPFLNAGWMVRGSIPPERTTHRKILEKISLIQQIFIFSQPHRGHSLETYFPLGYQVYLHREHLFKSLFGCFGGIIYNSTFLDSSVGRANGC